MSGAFSIPIRLAFGTAIYVLIVVLAAGLPTASGLMLTFPALNGLAYVFARNEEVDDKTCTMIWMPVLNGLLCAAYIGLFLRQPALHGDSLAELLLQLAVLLTVWGFIAKVLLLTGGIAARWRSGFAILVLVAGAMAAVALWPDSQPMTALPGQAAQPGDLLAVLDHNRLKIGLFAAVLFAYLVISEYCRVPAGLKGVLAGLPLLPFFGLLSIALDDTIAIDARLSILNQMGFGLCLAPAIAVLFIHGVSAVLVRACDQQGRPGMLQRFAVVACGWLVCGLVIAVLGQALSGAVTGK